jgi:hypothetical protein
MKELARDNMPFMALEIHGLEEVNLQPVILKNPDHIWSWISI